MVRSMTGYGRAKQERNGRSITVEVRSVNNRYLDCTVKMPRAYIFAEDAMKALCAEVDFPGKGGRVCHHGRRGGGSDGGAGQ